MSTPVTPLPPRSPWRYVWRTVLGIVVVLLLLIGGLAWYATTSDFSNRVRKYVIATLEQSTGGRVELQAFRWRLLHLAFEADNLTIHGLEGPGEVPYAHLDRLYVRAKIVSFFRPKIDLNYLEVDHPVVHLIIYPDGSTNQPSPKTVRNGKPLKDTIFDLQIGRTELNNGVALLNQRAIPFNLAANDLGAIVTYSASRDHYLATLHAADIMAQRGKSPAVHSVLDVQADMGRNSLDVPSLKLKTGDSLLEATASVNNFAAPQWKMTAQGNVDLREVEALAAVPGIDKGVVDLQLKGQGTKTVFSVDGQSSLIGVAYRTSIIHLSGVSADAALHATQDELAVTGIRARLAAGGSLQGDMRILHWMSTAPKQRNATVGGKTKEKTVAAGPVQQASIRAKVQGVTLRTVLAIVAPPKFKDLGFDTSGAGALSVDWTGSAADLTAAAKMTLTSPTSLPPGELPLSGTVDAAYFNRNGTVQVRELQAQTPATHVQVTGGLGVYPSGRRSTLQVDLTTTNLGEFNGVLKALGPSGKGKKGMQTLPVALHGHAAFNGNVSGTLAAPDVKGHLSASNFDLLLQASAPVAGAPASLQAVSETAAPKTIHWDSLSADAEYSPALIAIQQAALTHGKTVIHASGQLPRHTASPRGATPLNDNSAINAELHIQNASLADLIAIAGKNISSDRYIEFAGARRRGAEQLDRRRSCRSPGRRSVWGALSQPQYRPGVLPDTKWTLPTWCCCRMEDKFAETAATISPPNKFTLTRKAAASTLRIFTNCKIRAIRLEESSRLPHGARARYRLRCCRRACTSPSCPWRAWPRGMWTRRAHTQGNQLLLNVHANLNSAQLQMASQDSSLRRLPDAGAAHDCAIERPTLPPERSTCRE